MKKADLFIDAQCILAEGPLWVADEQALYWVDIEGMGVCRYADEQFVRHEFDQMVGAIVQSTGGFLLALEKGIYHYEWKSKKLTLIDSSWQAEGMRANDGKVDPLGNFWVGTMSITQPSPNRGTLYLLNDQGQLSKMISNRKISNGLAWDTDKGRMYYIDTLDYCVRAYEYTDGEITNGEKVIEIDSSLGGPDGMCIDEEGMLWIAHWGGSCVRRWDPSRSIVLDQIDVPALHVSSCAFGGPNMDQLYITTARAGLTPDQLKNYPLSGGVFTCQLDVRGAESSPFKLGIKS
ncbi:MAG: SMP-30/gluconolactonase/LRE family protein [Cyclobacteriaceae bacterium]